MQGSGGLSIFRDQHVIFTVVHWVKPAVVLAVNCMLEVLKTHADVVLVIMDSAAPDEIKDYLRTLRHDRVIMETHAQNIGKAHSVNAFIARHMHSGDVPKTVSFIDPDILFDVSHFDYLQEAVQNIERIGMLSMRYVDNGFNPERNLWFPPRKIKGKNGKIYEVTFPIFANVCGGIFSIPGKLLAHPLQFRLFPVAFREVYGPDDAALFDTLKRSGYRCGYLNGTLATHLKSGDKYADEING